MVIRKSDTSRILRVPLAAGSVTAKRGSSEMPEECSSIFIIKEVSLISSAGVSSICREARKLSKVWR